MNQFFNNRVFLKKGFCFFVIAGLSSVSYAESLSRIGHSKAFSKEEKPSSQNKAEQTENKQQEKEDFQLKPAPLPTHNMGAEWQGVRFVDGVSTYKLAENPKVIGIFQLQKKREKLDRKKFQSNDFFETFVQQKKEGLMLMNIREWTPDQHKIKKRKKFIELNVSGSYKRAEGDQVFFREEHIYFSNRVFQILVISPEKKALRARSVKSFFKKAQKIGMTKKEK